MCFVRRSSGRFVHFSSRSYIAADPNLSAKVSLNMTICMLYQAVAVQLATSRMLHESSLTGFMVCVSDRVNLDFRTASTCLSSLCIPVTSIAVILAVVVIPSHKLGAPCEAARAVAPTGIHGIPPGAGPTRSCGEQHLLYDCCNDVLIFLIVNYHSSLANGMNVF